MATILDPTALPPPLHDLPTAKQKKYDRQLRLWGASGQEALEESHILLINSGSGVTGVEALKNLVLPGLGHFTLVDSAVVSEADLGVNFFLDDTSLGKFRAEETVRLLVELNPGVQGHAVTEVRPVLKDVVKGNADGRHSLSRRSSRKTTCSPNTALFLSPLPSIRLFSRLFSRMPRHCKSQPFTSTPSASTLLSPSSCLLHFPSSTRIRIRQQRQT